MPKLVISGIAHAYAGDPRSGEPVGDEETFALLHGLHSEAVCSEAFDELPLSEMTIGGGRLRFVHDPDAGGLRITTAYDVDRELTEDEVAAVVGATLAQWSDGIGSGSFRYHRGRILSTALAMALQNVDPLRTDLGNIFVDAYPAVEDRNLRVKWYEMGAADDDLVRDLVTAASSGDADALLELGDRYKAGDGVEQNHTVACELYGLAAARGHPVGAMHYGECLLYGRGTVPSREVRGADQDQARAVGLFRECAAAGLPRAMHYLGECYTKGYGVAVDLEEAASWYRNGADLGDPVCLAELGDCLEFGRGVYQDLHAALRCYRQALAAGFDPVEEAIARVEGKLGRQ